MPEAAAYTFEELKEALKQAREAEVTKDRELKSIKDANSQLDQAIKDIGGILADYEKKLLGFQKDYDRQTCYQADTSSRVKEALGDPGPVDQKIKAYDETTERLRKEIADLLTPKVTKAREELEQAEADEAKAKAEFDALKAKAATLDRLLKQLDDLAKQIDSHEKDAKLGKAWFLLKEHAAVLDEIKRLEIQSKADFERDLIKARKAHHAAILATLAKKATYDQAVAERDAKQKELDKRIAERRTSLLAELS